MTCRVTISSSRGPVVKARALLDSGSSASFISDCLSRSLNLPRDQRSLKISGIAGLSHNSTHHFFTTFQVGSCNDISGQKLCVSAIIIPTVTCDLPTHPISVSPGWSHLSGLPLADPDFGCPGAIDLLLGVDVFSEALLQGRRIGPPGSPVALETIFGWVLAGSTQPRPQEHLVVYHSPVMNCYASFGRRRKPLLSLQS